MFVLEAVSDIDVWDSKLNANLPAIKFEYTFEIGERLRYPNQLGLYLISWRSSFSWRCNQEAHAISIYMLRRIFFPKFF